MMPENLVFEILLQELDSHFPEVILCPAPEMKHSGHCVRVAIDKNCQWYRRLCEKYPSSRADNPGGKRTKVKREHIRNLLSRLAAGEVPNSQYTFDLINEAKKKSQELQDRYI